MLSKRHKAFFNTAKQMASLSDFKNQHIGAVAVYRHKIISSGYNTNKSNPLQRELNSLRFDIYKYTQSPHTLHAEVSCLLPLRHRKDINFSEIILYVYRIKYSTDSKHGLARPCKSCMKFITDLGIRNICYTTDDGFAFEKLCY